MRTCCLRLQIAEFVCVSGRFRRISPRELRYHMCVALGVTGGGLNAHWASLLSSPLRPLMGASLALTRSAKCLHIQVSVWNLRGKGPLVPGPGPAGSGYSLQHWRDGSACFLAGYSLLTFLFVAMYMRARHHAARKEYNISTPWHLGVHLLGNLGNVFLYPGLRSQ